MFRKLILILFIPIVLSSCKGQEMSPKVRPPGEKKTAETRTLESGTAVLQRKEPFNGFSLYLNGFHYKDGDFKTQMQVHHYCNHINEDVYQCALFDGNTKNAHLVGVEYIISSRIYTKLPEEEKPLWHSHAYEVKSGLLVAPGLYDAPEHKIMERLASTYGKALHSWVTNEGQNLPLANPVLMMAFSSDGQLDEALLKRRDRKFGISTAKEAKRRANIKIPPQ